MVSKRVLFVVAALSSPMLMNCGGLPSIPGVPGVPGANCP